MDEEVIILLKSEVIELKEELKRLSDEREGRESNHQKEITKLIEQKQKIEKINIDINKGWWKKLIVNS